MQCTVFKRLSENNLITLLSRSLHQKRMTSLLTLHHKDSLEESLWDGTVSVFTGEVICMLRYAITVQFTSKYNNNESWLLTTVYGPCQGYEREEFVNWLNDLQIQDDDN